MEGRNGDQCPEYKCLQQSFAADVRVVCRVRDWIAEVEVQVQVGFVYRRQAHSNGAVTFFGATAPWTRFRNFILHCAKLFISVLKVNNIMAKWPNQYPVPMYRYIVLHRIGFEAYPTHMIGRVVLVATGHSVIAIGLLGSIS